MGVGNLAGDTALNSGLVLAARRRGGDGRQVVGEWVRELWQHRELLYFFVWRDVKIRYRQTALGVIWAVLQPIVTMLILWIVFSRVPGIAQGDTPYPLFVFCALVAWTYFSTVLTSASTSLVSNTNLLTKVYFPRATLTMATIVGGLPDLLLSSLALVGLMAYYQIAPDWGVLLWVPLVALLMLLALGMGLFLAALNARFRDVKYAVPFAIQLWMFASPIIYPSTIVPERIRPLLILNPLTGIIEALRAALLPSRAIDWTPLGVSVLVTLVLLVGGITYFRRAERTLADVI